MAQGKGMTQILQRKESERKVLDTLWVNIFLTPSKRKGLGWMALLRAAKLDKKTLFRVLRGDKSYDGLIKRGWVEHVEIYDQPKEKLVIVKVIKDSFGKTRVVSPNDQGRGKLIMVSPKIMKEYPKKRENILERLLSRKLRKPPRKGWMATEYGKLFDESFKIKKESYYTARIYPGPVISPITWEEIDRDPFWEAAEKRLLAKVEKLKLKAGVKSSDFWADAIFRLTQNSMRRGN